MRGKWELDVDINHCKRARWQKWKRSTAGAKNFMIKLKGGLRKHSTREEENVDGKLDVVLK